MKSHYKRLGDYIREVNVRNRDLAVTRLLGVSIQKVFMPSIANTIGTDMVTYKIVEKGQFGYGPVTSRNGDKVSIALLTEYDNAIISQAYTVFEVIDREKLMPEYLMMWFRRAEFDRYARFKSHGSAREIFDWSELCDIQLPIPAIEVQREIVSEYEALSRRVALNESLCDKLEQAAAALYRKTFIENIDPQNLPHGWRMGTISDLVEVKDGTHDSPEPCHEGFQLITSTHLCQYNLNKEDAYKISQDDYIAINKRSLVEYKDILFSMIGTVGTISYVLSKNVDFAIKNVALFKTSARLDISEYILFCLKSDYVKQYIISNPNGSTQNYITLSMLRNLPIVVPSNELMIEYTIKAHKIINFLYNKVSENVSLQKMQSLLLSKLATN